MLFFEKFEVFAMQRIQRSFNYLKPLWTKLISFLIFSWRAHFKETTLPTIFSIYYIFYYIFYLLTFYLYSFDIFNADEFELIYSALPLKILHLKGEKYCERGGGGHQDLLNWFCCWKHGWGKTSYVRDSQITKTSLFQGNKEP